MSNITTIAVSQTGKVCADSVMGQDLLAKLASGHKVDFGYVRLESGTRIGDWATRRSVSSRRRPRAWRNTGSPRVTAPPSIVQMGASSRGRPAT